MFVKFIHYIGATVHDRVGLVMGVLTDSVASKATDLVLVNEIGCLYGINVIIVFVDGGEEGLEVTDQVKWETKPSRFVSEFCNTLFGVLGVGVSHVLRRVSFTVGNVAFKIKFGTEGVETRIAHKGGAMMLCSTCDEA